MSKAAVECRGISRYFGDKAALSNIDLRIEAGEFLVLLGPSGGGKTTLLNIIGGFLEPSSGRVLIDGVDVTDVPPARRPTTTVFQDYALFPHMSIAGNVGFGLKMRGVAKRERVRRVADALDMVGLGDTGARRVHELSGGQRQRVALARSLVVEPAVLLLDEPLGALDMKLRRQMQEELKAIQKRVGTTFVHVTHDQDEAMAIADTVVVMNDAVIEDNGPPERVYLRPASRFTAGFMGDSNLLEGEVLEADGDNLTVRTALGPHRLPGAAAAGDRVTLCIRPEHLRLDASGDVRLGRASIESLGFFGTHHQCLARLVGLDTPFKVRLPQRLDADATGRTLELSVDAADVVVLTR